jgi:hypothetical protein
VKKPPLHWGERLNLLAGQRSIVNTLNMLPTPFRVHTWGLKQGSRQLPLTAYDAIPQIDFFALFAREILNSIVKNERKEPSREGELCLGKQLLMK